MHFYLRRKRHAGRDGMWHYDRLFGRPPEKKAVDEDGPENKPTRAQILDPRYVVRNGRPVAWISREVLP